MLRLPIEVKRADGAEFRDGGPEDAEVDVVAEVDPHGDEEAETGTDDYRVHIVERFGCLPSHISRE